MKNGLRCRVDEHHNFLALLNEWMISYRKSKKTQKVKGDDKLRKHYVDILRRLFWPANSDATFAHPQGLKPGKLEFHTIRFDVMMGELYNLLNNCYRLMTL